MQRVIPYLRGLGRLFQSGRLRLGCERERVEMQGFSRVFSACGCASFQDFHLRLAIFALASLKLAVHGECSAKASVVGRLRNRSKPGHIQINLGAVTRVPKPCGSPLVIAWLDYADVKKKSGRCCARHRPPPLSSASTDGVSTVRILWNCAASRLPFRLRALMQPSTIHDASYQ